MSRQDFQELHERVKELYRPQVPPPFDEVWWICGRNPRCLERVAQLGFDVEVLEGAFKASLARVAGV